MVSRKLMGAWALFDFCLLVSGVISVVFSFLWRKPDLLMNLTISNSQLTGGLILGIALLVTFAISIGAVVQRNHITVGFVILNWVLVIDSLFIIVVGTAVWWFTLRERDNFHQIWLATDRTTRLAIQDRFSCCGYFSANDAVEIGGNFCVSQDFANRLDVNNPDKFCVTPITSFADFTLNNVFSSIYGFMAVVICLFLASLCVIKKRQEDERFKRIDAKRGGRGFV